VFSDLWMIHVCVCGDDELLDVCLDWYMLVDDIYLLMYVFVSVIAICVVTS
jgi:hypothetical protein